MLIRKVEKQDLEDLVRVENLCFPEAEAATRESFQYRIQAFPDSFYVAMDGDRLVGMVNGCVSNQETITDELFEPEGGHNPEGLNQMIFGLAVDPSYQKQGIAAQLMERLMEEAKAAGRKKMVLTCKEGLIPYYEKFGYVNQGVSQSVHGGAVWYDLVAEL